MRPVRDLFRIMLAAIAPLAMPAGPASSAPTALTGWRFHPGDDPRFADPAHDDSAWRAIRVPGGWQSQGLAGARGYGWYRVRFTAPSSAEPLAILLGRINNADEVFLNGVRVGATGFVGAAIFDARGKARVYRLPADLLRAGGENLLAVRVFNYFLTGGIVEGPVMLASASTLEPIGAALDREFLTVAAVQLVLVLLTWLACVVLYLANPREVALLIFSLSPATWIVWIVLDALPVIGVASPWIERVAFAGEATLYLAWLGFAARCVAPRLNPVERGLAVLVLVAVVAALALPAQPQRLGLSWVSFTLLFAVFGATCYRLIEAFSRRIATRWILLAVIASSAMLILYAMLPIDFPTAPNPGVLVLLVMTTALGIDVYRRAADQLRESARRLATIQAMERARIARDLHDDVAQRLGAVRLSLQLLQQSRKDSTLAAAVDELGASLDRVRGVAHALGGPFAQGRAFSEAVRQHFARFSHQAGVAFEIELPPDVDAHVSGQTAEHLFAIMQEAAGNAVRHGRATRVSLGLTMRGRHLSLAVKDNGIGFDPRKPSDGIGLSTMRQRAGLLGGELGIASAPAGGTTIVVDAPLRHNRAERGEA